LDDLSQCPLRNGTVDVTLAVRDEPSAVPARSEDGVLCSLRRHVPVVVAGNVMFDPFEKWAAGSVTAGEDVVDACERVATMPLPKPTQIAAEAARQVLEAHGLPGASVLVAVRRTHGSLEVELRGRRLPQAVRNIIAVRIMAALRANDSDARGIDVQYVEFPE
jgi:hypothetical protein